MQSNKIISSREQEVLELTADELTAKEIANQLYISTHTVLSHRKKSHGQTSSKIYCWISPT